LARSAFSAAARIAIPKSVNRRKAPRPIITAGTTNIART
jgi:hypothetical protein